MARALLLCVVLLLAGCASHAPIEPTALEPLAATPIALVPAGDPGEAVATMALYGLMGLGVVAVFFVDLLLLPAYLATEKKGLWFPCCRFLF